MEDTMRKAEVDAASTSEGFVSTRQRLKSTNSSCSCSEQCCEDVWDRQVVLQSPHPEYVSYNDDISEENECKETAAKEKQSDLTDAYQPIRHEEDTGSSQDEPMLPTTAVYPSHEANGKVVFHHNDVKLNQTQEQETKKSLMERFDAWVDHDPKYVPGFGTVMQGIGFIICFIIILCLALVITTSEDCNKRESVKSLALFRASLNAMYDQVSSDLWNSHISETEADALTVWHMVVPPGDAIWRMTVGNQVWLWHAGHHIRIHMVTPHRNYSTVLLGGATSSGPLDHSVLLPDGAWVATETQPSDQWAALTIITQSDVIFKNSSSEQKTKLRRIFPKYSEVTSRMQ